MKLYNTATKSIQDLYSDGRTLGIYTCGPTVYDYPHIGNWFTFIRYDLLVRTLRTAGYKTNWVMNITDVGHLVSDADEGEDKLEKGARREGRTAWEIAAYYADYFISGMAKLNMLTPDQLPKATDNIQEQIQLVQALEAKGYTYKIDDGIYFDTAKFERYAAFAELKLEDLHTGARIAINSQKKNPSDFALWKISPTDHKRDMEWDSPWGVGFPGWHLECSAMAVKYLDTTIDIHGGGIDHIPVHHTNEIAQSEAAYDTQYVRHWFHANHISVDGQKISKSLGNGITLEDLERAGFDPLAVRLYALESHYRSQSKFTTEGLQAAKQRLDELYAVAALRWQYITSTTTLQTTEALLNKCKDEVTSALQNDLNSPLALSAISQLDYLLSNGVPIALKDTFEKLLMYIDETLGLDTYKQNDVPDFVKEKLTARQAAREESDWMTADAIRDELKASNYGIKDTPNGQLWYRIAN